MNNQEQNSADKAAPQIELLPPSMTLRVGNRRLTMSWRPRKQLPHLLNRLLRRSWRAMFGSSLRMSATAVAICAAWNVPAMAAAPDVNTLPTGGTVTYGNATFSQTGNTLNINQTTGQAIANFTTFSIGANAVVNVNQPSAAAAFLARVTGSDPSLIYGLLKSNGTVALINQNGILVGPTGVVDVARFIASTLRISDSDFLAGRLNFSNGSLAGNIENQGTIKTTSGGSVYLIGANVSNSGVITSPNGEILLVAGQTVQLVDTGTPGVTVNVTGTTGKVTNLGSITAEAGRIGIAAGLITNSGNINASSVVSDGGRIFLRASQNLTTTATSKITADGVTKGGSVVLYSDKVAYLDGDISATGATGQGGFIETSGKQSLDVVKLPTVGSGGEWYIDPYNLEVVTDTANNITPSGGNPNVITSDSSSSYIAASTINTQLNSGTSVTLVTGSGGSADGGNITVSADITKSSGGAAALTLNADNNIVINANVTSTSDKLALNLNTNVNGATTGVHWAQVNGATIGLNGGTLTVSEGVAGSGNGNLSINNGGIVNLSSNLMFNGLPVGGSVNTGNLTINAGGQLTNIFGSNVVVNGALLNNGILNLQNSHLTTNSLTNGASFTLGNVSGSLGTVLNTGTLNLTSLFAGVTSTSINNTGTLTLSNSSTLSATGTVSNRGTLTLNNGSTLNAGTLNTSVGSSTTLNVATLHAATVANAGTMTLIDSSATASDQITNTGVFALSNGTINTVNGFVNQIGATLNLATQAGFNNGAVSNLGTLNVGGANIKFENGMSNAGTMTVEGSVIANGTMSNVATGVMNLGSAGTTTTLSGSGHWENSGTIGVTDSGNTVSIGGTLQNNLGGTVQVTGSGTQLNADQFTNAGTFTLGSGSSSSGSSFTNSGTTTLNGSGMSYGTSFLNDVGGTLSGTGSITTGTLINNGTLAPGGDGTIGTLAILGNYEQQSAGTLKIDVSSTGNDVLDLAGMGSLVLNGTLQTKLLNGYAPALGASPVTFITGTTQNDQTGVFRHVIGDVLTDGTLRMFKPTYSKGTSGLSFSMRGSETIAFEVEGSQSWGNADYWSTHYFPTAIDDVLVYSSATLVHAASDGIDTVNSITLNSGGGLTVNGGTVNVGNNISLGNNARLDVNSGAVNVANITSSGYTYVTVGGSGSGGGEGEGEGGYNGFSVVTEGPPASLNISGSARMNSLSVSGSGVVTGGTGSVLNVADNFSQSSGSVINSNGTVALSKADGDLMVGNITARNLVLQSQNGAISQSSASLHVKEQLITSSVTGTTLNSGTNRIAAFAGNNRGMGDIVLVNNLESADTGVVRLNGITNANGSISINNTGGAITTALGSGADFLTTLPTDPDLQSVPTLADRLTTLGIATNGTVSVGGPSHSVTLATHSPLTIGNGGVTSSGGITLSAGAPDNLVINGAITSTGGGAISLAAGGSISVNANIFTQGLYSGTPNPVYAAGVSVTDINGTTIPVAQIIQQIISPAIAQSIAPASSTVVTSITTTQAVNNTVVPTMPTSTPNPVTSSTTLTTGGEPGSFGGSDTADSSSGKGTSGPASAKTTKMYCN